MATTPESILRTLDRWMGRERRVADHVRLTGVDIGTGAQVVRPRKKIQQHRAELVGFVREILVRLPGPAERRIALEIGLYAGGTHVVWNDLFGLTISVDVDYLGIAGFMAELDSIDRSHFICADSTHPDARKALDQFLSGRPVDLLFIDGDHAYASVKSDFESFEPVVRRGGIVAFHDTVIKRGPAKFIDELTRGDTEVPRGSIVHVAPRKAGISFYVK